MNDIKNVCVYSASSTKIAKVYFDVAEELGRLLAEKKINLINGAGCIGLMAATSDAALAAGGTVTGVIPHFMVEQGWHHTGLTRLIETETMHERKRMMADLSDGVIALPGGCGTLEELLEIITWKQLGLYLNSILCSLRIKLPSTALCLKCCKGRWRVILCVKSMLRSGRWLQQPKKR